jgi:hypothetical protein
MRSLGVFLHVLPATASPGMPPGDRATVTERRLQQFGKLFLVLLSVGFGWLVVLPAVGAQRVVAEHIDTQKKLGIDPSAMFYTELEISPTIASHVERLNEAHPASFWRISRLGTSSETRTDGKD